jgi:hypothetical protein
LLVCVCVCVKVVPDFVLLCSPGKRIYAERERRWL